MEYKHTARNTWEHYSAEKPSFEVYSHNMSLLIRESGLSEDMYYRIYGHLMGITRPLTSEEAKEIQKEREIGETERKEADLIRISRHAELLKLPEWEKELAASGKRDTKAVAAPVFLVAIFIGVLGYLLFRRKG